MKHILCILLCLILTNPLYGKNIKHKLKKYVIPIVITTVTTIVVVKTTATSTTTPVVNLCTKGHDCRRPTPPTK